MLTSSLLRLQNPGIVLWLCKQMVLRTSISTLQETAHLHLFFFALHTQTNWSFLFSVPSSLLCYIFLAYHKHLLLPVSIYWEYAYLHTDYSFSSATVLLMCQHICTSAKIAALEAVNILSQSLSELICCQYVSTYCLTISYLQHCRLFLQS